MRLLFLLLGVFVRPCLAEPFAVPTQVEWSPKAEKLVNEHSLGSAFDTALGLVQKFPPPGTDHLMGNPTQYGPDRSLLILNSTSSEVAHLLASFPHSKDMDAFTVSASNKSGATQAMVILLWDRLALHEKRVEIPLPDGQGVLLQEKTAPREDVTTRTSVALAHELFGNAEFFLERGSELPKDYRQEAETRSFQQGLDFIDRILALPGIENLGNTETHFVGAREREQEGLNSWQRSKKCRFSPLNPK